MRRKVVANGLAAAVSLGVWAVIDGHLGSPMFMLAGYMSVPTLLALYGWWRHVRDGEAAVVRRAQDREAALAEAAALTERLHARGMRVTVVLAALIIAIGVLQLAFSGTVPRSVEAAALVRADVLRGQWWRLVSSTYLHLSAIHLLANISVLVVLGRIVEAYSSRWRLPLVYAISGVAASLASVALISVTSAGASGAIMGVAGYLAAVSYLRPEALPRSVRLQVFMIAGLNLYIGAFGFAFINNVAHVGGLVAGAIVAWVCLKYEQDRGAMLLWAGRAAAVCLVLGAVGTAYALQRHGTPVKSARPVTSVTAALTGSRGAPTVTVANNSDQPLEAYRVEILSGRRVVETVWRDDCCFTALNGSAPIPPHTSKTWPLSPMELGMTVSGPTSRVTLAILADGVWEGMAEGHSAMIAQRQWMADDADYWLHALEADRGLPLVDFGASMRARMDERAHLSTFGRPSASVFGIPSLAASVGFSPQRFESEVNAKVSGITAARDALRLRLVPR